MSNKDIDRLIQLAKDRFNKGVSKEKALDTFVKAGILTKNGNLRKPYKELNTATTSK
jgi:hypothetical protein